MQNDFVLDKRLAADGKRVTSLALSEVLMMDDTNYPWAVLVPRRPGLVDLHDLASTDLLTLSEEIVRVSRAMSILHAAHKMNVAALGNQVRQLHVHVIVRKENDPAWPNPVWGKVPPKRHDPEVLEAKIENLLQALAQP